MARYILNITAFESHFCRMMCSLLESQILVDMTVTCKSYSLKVHKNVLAARSEYFREKLQKDGSIDSVLIADMKPTVLKSLISFIYCGRSSIVLEDLADLVYAGEYFRVSGIESVSRDTLQLDPPRKPALNLTDTPPLFFSNNVKVSPAKASKCPAASAKCSTPGSSKEARCLLVKEQAASEQALKEVQRNKSKLVVTADTSTVVTVEADLASAGFEPPEPEFLRPHDAYGDRIDEVYVLQPDTEDFVDTEGRVFDGHTVSYQLIPQAKGDLEIQEYICNTIGEYGVTGTNICFLPEAVDSKFQVTYAQLGAADINYMASNGGDAALVLGPQTAAGPEQGSGVPPTAVSFKHKPATGGTEATLAELTVAADSYDEDSAQSLFEQSVEWPKSPTLTYRVPECGDGRRPAKREPATDDESLQYLDLDAASIVKCARRDQYGARQPLAEQNGSFCTDIVPETQHSRAERPEAAGNSSNEAGDSVLSFNRHTRTAFDILSFGEARTEPSENRRQTRSLTKQRPSSLGF